MSSEQRVRGFFETYRAAFARYDAAAIADLFAYPGHVTSDTGEIVLLPVTSREPWLSQIGGLLANYRAIEVGSARLLHLEVADLSPRLCQAVVHWELSDQGGRALYDFEAAYTLVELGGALRISSIAHNELPRYQACVARLQVERSGGGPGPKRGAG